MQKREFYRYLLPLKNRNDWGQKIFTTINMYIFRTRKVTSIIFTLHDYFLHIALKIETELPKKLVKPIAETRNAYDVSMYIYSIHSW